MKMRNWDSFYQNIHFGTVIEFDDFELKLVHCVGGGIDLVPDTVILQLKEFGPMREREREREHVWLVFF